MAGIYLSSIREEQRLRQHWSTSAAGIASAGVLSYISLVTAAAPNLWWRLGETSGTTATDSGSGANNGTLTGGATFASPGVSIVAPPGYAGLGRGIDLSAASVADVRGPIGGVSFGGNATSSWTIVIWMAGSAGAGYAASRVNESAILNGFVANTVEFFSAGYTGTNPRTGSGISLPAADTTTPHMIVYRYDNGQWVGLKDGAEVFNVARSFGLPGSVGTLYLGSDSGASVCNSKAWDLQVYNRAVSTADLAAMYAARDVA